MKNAKDPNFKKGVEILYRIFNRVSRRHSIENSV